jgi:DNA-binding YbaB/EbfC family protein
MADQPFDLNAMMQEAQKMQEKLVQAQEAAKQQVVEGSSGGGMVTVTITGGLEVRKIKIDPSAVDPKDLAMLEDLIVAAFNQAITKAQEVQAEVMRKATGGLNLPGLF